MWVYLHAMLVGKMQGKELLVQAWQGIGKGRMASEQSGSADRGPSGGCRRLRHTDLRGPPPRPSRPFGRFWRLGPRVRRGAVRRPRGADWRRSLPPTPSRLLPPAFGSWGQAGGGCGDVLAWRRVVPVP